jgi:hypothetical protein
LLSRQTYLLIALLALLLLAWRPVQQPQWYRGNTHTHTINSDGDTSPDEVVRWYREHGYHFLVLSDHNFLTEVDGLNSIFGAKNKFTLIKGEEVTDQFGGKPIHLNGLNIRELVEPQHGSSILETVQNNVNAIRGVGGVPHVNHPNFQWAITSEHLRQVRNHKLFEIFNGHPRVHNAGGGGSASLEQMWDEILTAGKLIYGIAVDDAHHFKGEFAPGRSNPGRGWVVVRAYELSPAAILEAMENGSFYASTGVSLKEYQADGGGIVIQIDEQESFKYTTAFVGEGGEILATVNGPQAEYRFTQQEKYVRARVTDSMGHMAWLQPVFPGQPASSAK